MTIPVGTHGLTCLSDEDYGAFALWMQCVAGDIDSSLVSINASLNGFMDRPYWQATNIPALNVDIASGNIGPNGVVGTSLGGGVVVANDIPNSFSSSYRLPRGVYFIEATINYTVATPNNNTARTLEVYGMDVINGVESSQTTFRNLYQARVLEAGGAGNSGAISVQGLMFADGIQTRRVESFFYHSNSSSQIAVASGAWRFSLTYFGSGLVI